MSQLTPPYPLIRDGLCQGRVIPFLGAGASLAARAPDATWDKSRTTAFPTASELARYLAQRPQFPPDEPPDLTSRAVLQRRRRARSAGD